MRIRKKFERICKICGKKEIVRSDQLQSSCKECARKNLITINREWIKNNPEKHKEMFGKKNRKHGLWNTRIYTIYNAILSRCGHRNYVHKFSKYYADRGIKVCEEWLKDNKKFFKWAFENGYKDNLQIDRIDPNKGYSPDNCRWVTAKENQANRRDRLLTSPSF